MDKLSDLPTIERPPTPQEEEVMKKYFGAYDSAGSGNNKLWGETFKLAFLASTLFVCFGNSFIDWPLSMTPVGNSNVTILAFKTLLFFIMFVILYKFG